MSEYHRLIFRTKALNLPGFEVAHECRDTPTDPVRFTVVPIEKVAVSPKCGHACDKVNRCHESTDSLACVRDDQLQPLSPSRPPPLRMACQRLISKSGGEPQNQRPPFLHY